MDSVSETLCLIPPTAGPADCAERTRQVAQPSAAAAARSDCGRSGCVQPIGMILPAVLQRYQLLPQTTSQRS